MVLSSDPRVSLGLLAWCCPVTPCVSLGLFGMVLSNDKLFYGTAGALATPTHILTT